MKLLHTADLHAFPRPLAGLDRRDEWRRCASFIREYVAEQGVDLVVVAGDLFDRPRPDPEEFLAVYDFLKALAAAGAEVVAVPGTPSHDGDGPDRLGPTTLLASILGWPAAGRYSVDPGLLSIELRCGSPAVVGVLPGVSRSWLASRDEFKDLSPVALNAELAARLGNVIGGLAASAASAPGPHILIGHLSVDGCVASSDESIRMTAEPVLALGDLPDAFGAVCLGHIHGPQILQQRGPWVGYCGSWIRKDFSEEDDDRGFCVLGFDDRTGGLERVEFVDLPAARLLTVEADVRGATDPQQDLANLVASSIPTDADDEARPILRVRCRATEDQLKLLSPRALQEAAKAAGALHFAGLIPNIERATRARAEGVTEELSPLSALDSYISASPDLQPDREALVERARPLVEEVSRG